MLPPALCAASTELQKSPVVEPVAGVVQAVSVQLAVAADEADVAPVQQAAGGKKTSPRDIRPLWLEEKAIIERAINLCDGNVPRAAAFLEISASTIYRKRLSWDQ
jgi:two-component system repressor protein LuxO